MNRNAAIAFTMTLCNAATDEGRTEDSERLGELYKDLCNCEEETIPADLQERVNAEA